MILIIYLNDSGIVKMMENVWKLQAYLLLSGMYVIGIVLLIKGEGMWLKNGNTKKQ